MFSDLAAFGYLGAIVLAWAAAHITKYLIGRHNGSTASLGEHLFMSGGMPSSHSAVVVSVATMAGLREGFDSGLFAVAAALVLVVVYDAAHVRYMAGRTAYALNGMLKKDAPKGVKSLPVYYGHTGAEVIVGSLVGATVALVVFFATK